MIHSDLSSDIAAVDDILSCGSSARFCPDCGIEAGILSRSEACMHGTSELVHKMGPPCFDVEARMRSKRSCRRATSKCIATAPGVPENFVAGWSGWSGWSG